jgi:hypothetical protein
MVPFSGPDMSDSSVDVCTHEDLSEASFYCARIVQQYAVFTTPVKTFV